MTGGTQILHLRGPVPKGLSSLVLQFLNYHRDLASDGPALKQEARAALRTWTKDEDRRFFLLRQEGRLVGFMVLKKDPEDPVFWGDQMFVEPASRGRGIARAAMEFAESYVRRHGGDALYLNVAASNQRTLRIFHHLGYRTLNMVELRKDLKPGRAASRPKARRVTSVVRLWDIPLRVRRPVRTER